MKFKYFPTAQTQRQTTASIHVYCQNCTSQSARKASWLHQELRGNLWDMTWKICVVTRTTAWNVCTLLKYLAMSYAALRISNWSIYSTFPNNREKGMTLNFFLNWVLINKSIYLIFHTVITTGNWGVCGVPLQVGNTGYLEFCCSVCFLLQVAAQTLQRNYPSAKLTHWAYWGSNNTIRQITHQWKPDSMSSMFTEE